MSFQDMLAAIEGFNDAETGELNKLRHLVLAPSWAMGSKQTPKQLMPLPSIDGVPQYKSSMTKEQFMALAKKYNA